MVGKEIPEVMKPSVRDLAKEIEQMDTLINECREVYSDIASLAQNKAAIVRLRGKLSKLKNSVVLTRGKANDVRLALVSYRKNSKAHKSNRSR